VDLTFHSSTFNEQFTVKVSLRMLEESRWRSIGSCYLRCYHLVMIGNNQKYAITTTGEASVLVQRRIWSLSNSVLATIRSMLLQLGTSRTNHFQACSRESIETVL
jgi:hypothetical protein